MGVRLTRDGGFALNASGNLVTQAGFQVLDANDQPIVVPRDSKVVIDGAGRIVRQDNNQPVVARLQVDRVRDTDALIKQGQNLFWFKGRDTRQILHNPSVQTGYVEASGVDPIKTLMKLIAATKSAMGSTQMIRYFDLLMDRSVNTLGKVA